MTRLATGAAALIVLAWPAMTCPAEPAGSEPLPEPLTLGHALSLLDDSHPDLMSRRAAVAYSQAEILAADAATGVSARLRGRARVVQPHPDARGQGNDDLELRLFIEKPLYDFGRSELSRRAAEASAAGEEWLLLDARQQRWLSIASHFLQVLLADLRYARENEAMATAFVSMQRGQERNTRGQLSDVDLLALEHAYERARQRRFEQAAQQRASRARLAAALNRPEQLPSRVLPPRFAGLDGRVPEFETLLEQALSGNARLKARRAQLEAARDALRAVQAGDRATVFGELESGLNSRVTSRADYWRAGVRVEIPISSGGRLDAAVARQRSQVLAAEADLAGEEHSVREALLDTWLAMETLAIRREGARVQADYRDLYLDRSRALYEQQVRSDLGDAMVQSTQAQLDSAEAEFALALNLARLRLLTGTDPRELTASLLAEP